MPPRVAATEYQVHATAGEVTIGADFTGHAIPNSQEPLFSEDHIAVEVGLFGAPEARLVIASSHFSLRINGNKQAAPAQPWGLVANNIKDPEWAPPEGAAPKSKGGFGSAGGDGRQAGDPPPPPPKPPIELKRAWQQRLSRAALIEGDRTLPQAGLLFFAHRGKTENIRSLDLIYNGPAGKATLVLR